MLNLGGLSQMVVLCGWIPHDLDITVNSYGEYQMRFNFYTNDTDQNNCVVPCIVVGSLAKTFYEEFQKMDSVVIWGQLTHSYRPKLPRNLNVLLQVKVIAYNFLDDYIVNAKRPDMSDDKRQFIEQAANWYDNNQNPPAKEEIEYFAEYWRKWREDNIIKKKKE